MKKTLLTLLAFLAVSIAFGQTPPPSTDIHLFKLKEKKGKVTISNGKNITDRAGYDNQPSFLNNDHILYSSHQDGQNDIMIYDTNKKTSFNLSNSKDSEYSPTPIPGLNSYAVVRVEEDNSQRLWMYHMDKGVEPTLIFDEIMPVGYFAIIDRDILMFVLGQPATLVLANMEDQLGRVITSNIGRTIRKIPGTTEFTFERTEEDGSQVIYKLERPKNDLIRVVTKPEGTSDWTITQKGTYITSKGTMILAFNPKHHSEWQEVTDLDGLAMKGITRMAVNQKNNKLALVINN